MKYSQRAPCRMVGTEEMPVSSRFWWVVQDVWGCQPSTLLHGSSHTEDPPSQVRCDALTALGEHYHGNKSSCTSVLSTWLLGQWDEVLKTKQTNKQTNKTKQTPHPGVMERVRAVFLLLRSISPSYTLPRKDRVQTNTKTWWAQGNKHNSVSYNPWKESYLEYHNSSSSRILHYITHKCLLDFFFFPTLNLN